MNKFYILEISKDNVEFVFCVASPDLEQIKEFISKFKKEKKKAKLYKYFRVSQYVFDCYI